MPNVTVLIYLRRVSHEISARNRLPRLGDDPRGAQAFEQVEEALIRWLVVKETQFAALAHIGHDLDGTSEVRIGVPSRRQDGQIGCDQLVSLREIGTVGQARIEATAARVGSGDPRAAKVALDYLVRAGVTSSEAGDALDKGFRDIAEAEIEQFKRDLIQRDGAGAGDKVSDGELLREVMNTVGRKGKLGEQILERKEELRQTFCAYWPGSAEAAEPAGAAAVSVRLAATGNYSRLDA